MCDYDGTNEFQSIREVLTRKPHRCEECRTNLPAGSRAVYIAGKYEGDMFSMYLCLVCNAMILADEESAFHACHGDIYLDTPEWQEMACAIAQVREPSALRMSIYDEATA
jgi:hypothetical protein